MVTYDEKVLYQFAEQLYARAKQILVVYTLTGAILGAGVGWIVVQYRPQLGTVAIAGLAVLFGLLGFSSAQQKAFALRLEAQRLLVLAKIEENTHR